MRKETYNIGLPAIYEAYADMKKSQGQYGEAEAYYRKALWVFKEENADSSRGRASGIKREYRWYVQVRSLHESIGDVCREQNRLREAYRNYIKALNCQNSIMRDINNEADEPEECDTRLRILFKLVLTARMRGRYEERLVNTASELARQLYDSTGNDMYRLMLIEIGKV